MFRALSSQAAPGSGGESEDDSISVTSTVSIQYDPDQEFVVKGILAERYDDVSGLQYLIEWENFDIKESTWEPVDGINDQLTRIWQETKDKQDSGAIEPFDVDAWRQMVEQARSAKFARHFRRNKKRKKLGLPETEPIQAEPIRMKRTSSRSADHFSPAATTANDSESSDSEAEVWDEPLIESVATQRKGKDAVKAPSTVAAPPLKTPSTARAGVALPPVRKGSGTTSQLPSTSKAPAVARPTPPRRDTKAPATTGYQGTARKPVGKPAPAKNAVAPGAKTTARDPPGPSDPHPRNPAALNTKANEGGEGSLTAKRTKTVTRAGNILTSGKVPKPRLQMQDVMGDKTKHPKHFSNHHLRRVAEKRGWEERAPDPASLQLFNLTKGLPPTKSSGLGAGLEETSAISPSTEVTGSLHHMQAGTEAHTARDGSSPQLGHGPSSVLGTGLASGQAPDPSSGVAPLKSALKSKSLREHTTAKKVVFADQEGDDGGLFVSTAFTGSPEPMDSEPSESLERPVGRVLRSPPPPQTKPMWKKVALGQRNASIKARFTGLPPSLEQISIPWRNALLGPEPETLFFRHICMAQTVQARFQSLAVGNTASGYLETQDGDGPAVEALARFLTIGALGLYYPHPTFNLLVYPAQCNEWKAAIRINGEGGDDDPSILLRFWISDTAFDFKSIMRPWDLNIGQPPTWQSQEYPNSSSQEMISLMKHWFGFDYEKLLPARKNTSSSPDSFFLAFPSSKSTHTQVLSFWLRSCNPQCRLFFGVKPGSWEAFTSALRQDGSAGVVIVHESLAWTLRRFPKLSESLHGMDDQYWCFSDPNSPRPLYPSAVLEDQLCAPVTPKFIQLFPDRAAILLTPSFLVSKPTPAQRVLTWFLSNPANGFRLRLVAGWDLPRYLSELASEKADARQKLKSSHDAGVDHEIRSRGLSHEQCNERFISSIKAMEIHCLRLGRMGPFEAEEEENSPVIYAPPSIDPNDEQSLVNWFGWWSLQQADQFRHFWVLGTDDQPSNPRLFERRIQIPKYTRVTINDPDAVLETIQQHYQSESAQQSEAWTANTADSRPPAVALEYLSPRSDVLSNDGAAEFRKALVDLETNCQGPWTLLYNKVVSWDGPDMVNHFYDYKEEYDRISTWWQFGRVLAQRRQNTYIGFFYTIEEEWNPKTIPPGSKPKRHPWIAMYRPVNSFKRPWDRYEIIIWDPCARTKFPCRKRVGEGELSYMQRRVIEYLRQEAPKRDPGTWIDQVWLGGFETFPGDNSRWPIDRTLGWLKAAMQDAHHFLPAPEHAMVPRGYRPVVPTTAAQPTEHDLGGSPMDLDSSDSEPEDDDDARIIFHPPRGAKLPSGQPTKCINNLYETARLARARDRRDTTMLYTFRSTRSWYEKQVAEGRDFQHINVEFNFDRFWRFFHSPENPLNLNIGAGPRASD